MVVNLNCSVNLDICFASRGSEMSSNSYILKSNQKFVQTPWAVAILPPLPCPSLANSDCHPYPVYVI